MDIQHDEVTINGNAYVLKDSVKNQPAEQIDGMNYCIVRTYSAGVFAGYVKSRNGMEVELVKFRRIWRWKGALTLSEMSIDGVDANGCNFSVETPSIIITQAIEILPCSEKARKSIIGVPLWEK